MLAALGDVLPLALGVAISPVPVIAAILMLLSPRARATGVGFALGWVLGVTAAVALFVALAGAIPESSSDGPHPVAGVVKIVLGVAMLVLAVRQWRHRPRGEEQVELPRWMAAVDSISAARAFGLGVLLSAVNPKNLLMAAGAGITIGSAELAAGGEVVVVVVFVLVASSTVAGPVVAYLVASQAVEGPLQSLRRWLTANNATVMGVLLLVLGVVLLGRGLESL